jgi:hypothetical protein
VGVVGHQMPFLDPALHIRVLWRLTMRSLVDGQPETTHANVKLLLPTRQSLGELPWGCSFVAPAHLPAAQATLNKRRHENRSVRSAGRVGQNAHGRDTGAWLPEAGTDAARRRALSFACSKTVPDLRPSAQRSPRRRRCPRHVQQPREGKPVVSQIGRRW